jgi:predicted CoA-substrate-specific enzyme activase
MGGLTLGIDCGSTTVKGVLFADGAVQRSILLPTGARPQQRMREIYDELHTPEVRRTVTTGYGRQLLPEADRRVTEITCHARGAVFLGGGAIGGLVDIGGQDSKAVLLDGRGSVSDFLMNDKCAAGTGRFLDVMARVLEVRVEDLGMLGDESTKEIGISSTCTVFAESEVISQLAVGTDKRDIINGIHKSVAARVVGLCHRVGVRDQVVMTGGVAQNHGIVKALASQLQHEIHTSPLTQYNGALGAALFAFQKANK